MDLLLLSIAGSPPSGRRQPDAATLLREAGARSLDTAGAGADAASVDAVLDRRDGRRLVIEADRTALALVLARLMRRGELGEAETALLPTSAVGYLGVAGLPTDRRQQARCAVQAAARLVGVVKDDSGGVCVDGAVLTPWPEPAAGTSGWWVRAVVDDQRLCDGPVRSVEMRRLGPATLQATARTGRVRRQVCTGRSLQLACDPALVVSDGMPRERPRSRRTFWSEPTLWKLALG